MVEWRAYTIAELTTAPVAEAAFVVILGRVAVPGAGPISAGAFTPELRRDAWANRSQGLESGIQLVENGHWDLAEEVTISGGVNDRVVAWQNSNLFAANLTWRIVTTAPRSGPRELEILGTGAATEVQSMFGDTQPSVAPGDLIRVRYYIRGNVWGGIGGAGVQGIQLNFYDSDRQLIASRFVQDVTLSGTFAYTLIDGIVEVPAGSAFMCYAIRLDTNGATPAGSIFFDEIRIWKQSQQILQEDTRERMGFETAVAGAVHLIPPFSVAADMDDSIQETLRVQSLGASGTVVSILAAIMGSTAKGFDVDATGMGVQVQRRIKDLGAALLATAANTDTTRIELPLGASGVTRRTLIWETKGTAHGPMKHRMYLSGSGGPGTESIEFTINCKWAEGTALWTPDSPGAGAGFQAHKFQISQRGVLCFIKSPTNTGAWADTAWDGNGTSGRNIEIDAWTNQILTYDGFLGFRAASLTAATNPVATDAIAENFLYAKNLVKAWGQIDINAGVLSALNTGTADGFGVSSYALTDAGFSVSVTVTHAFADSGGTTIGYAPIVSIEEPNCTLHVVRVSNSVFKIFARDVVAAAAVDFSNAGSTLQLFWTIFGTNVST